MTPYIRPRFMSSLRRRGIPAGHVEDRLADPKPTGPLGVELDVRGVSDRLLDGVVEFHGALDFAAPGVSALGLVREEVIERLDVGLVDLEANVPFAHVEPLGLTRDNGGGSA
jgi:hypothetical protein